MFNKVVLITRVNNWSVIGRCFFQLRWSLEGSRPQALEKQMWVWCTLLRKLSSMMDSTQCQLRQLIIRSHIIPWFWAVTEFAIYSSIAGAAGTGWTMQDDSWLMCWAPPILRRCPFLRLEMSGGWFSNLHQGTGNQHRHCVEPALAGLLPEKPSLDLDKKSVPTMIEVIWNMIIVYHCLILIW